MTKESLCAALGAIGGAIASAFGGWDAALNTLIGFMAADYVTGLIVAGVFRKSGKSESGGLESRAGLKGLVRKGMMLAIVYVAAQLDILIGATFVRNSTVIAFVVNETLSILENAALMGVPMPGVLTNALEVLKRKADNPSGTPSPSQRPSANATPSAALSANSKTPDFSNRISRPVKPDKRP